MNVNKDLSSLSSSLPARPASRFSIKRESLRRSLGETKHYADRDDTPLEQAVDRTWDEAHTFAERIRPEEGESLLFQADMKDAVFCGHLMADLDSIGGAIGAAVRLNFF